MSNETAAKRAAERIKFNNAGCAPRLCIENIVPYIEAEYSQTERIAEAAKAYVAAQEACIATISADDAPGFSKARGVKRKAYEALKASVQGENTE